MNLQTTNLFKSPSSQAMDLELWKIQINTANNAFIHGRLPQALEHYEAALDIAKKGVDELLNTPEATHLLYEAERQIAALIVTHHNLADLFHQSSLLEKTVAHLCDAHEILFQLSHHQHAGLSQLGQRHLKITTQALMTFAQQHDTYIRVQQSLMLTQYVCECCRKKSSH